MSDDEMIAALAEVLRDHGRLGYNIIRDDPRTPAPSTYVARFGGLTAAYKRVGYTPDRQQRLAAERIHQHKPYLQRGKYADLWHEDD